MSRATQIYSHDFDRRFGRLSPDVQRAIQEKIYDLGLRLASFPHHQLTGSTSCRLRVGDYRVIYEFDGRKNELRLLAVGHRREISR